jgi:hypothetical protein
VRKYPWGIHLEIGGKNHSLGTMFAIYASMTLEEIRACTYTKTNTHRDTETETNADTHTQTYIHTDTKMDTCRDRETQRHTHT